MAKGDTPNTCLICKHELLPTTKVNIFKRRTTISRTLLSSRLTKIVQDAFNPRMLGSHDVCANCCTLLNNVDECECKLMALENEVKLKYKMPFAIEVQSSVEEDAAAADPLAESVSRAQDHGAALTPGPEQQQQQQHDLSSIKDENRLERSAVVINQNQLDPSAGFVIYRDPSNMLANQTVSMPDLDDLIGDADVHGDGGNMSDSNEYNDGTNKKKRKSSSKQKSRPKKRPKPESAGGLPLSAAADLLSELTGAASGGGDFSCPLCGEKYSSAKCLRAHIASHSNKKTYSCGFCPQEFPNHVILHNHWNREHPLQLKKCPHCDKRFVTTNNLRRHVALHKEPTLKCEVCGKLFHYAGDLRKHRLRHSNVRKYQCPKCPLKFKMNWMLTRHNLYVHEKKV